jgi:hypothetical protein
MDACQCSAGQCRHLSDCAVHNAPAMPNGPCDCGPDWDAIEAEYRTSDWSLRDIAAKHGVTVAAICERAKKPAESREVRK